MTDSTHSARMLAGAASADVTPEGSVFLVGYPHVDRMSTGVADRLQVQALYLSEGSRSLVLVSLDLLFVTQEMTQSCRERIQQKFGIPSEAVMLGATHTHSGPVTNAMLAWEADPIVPAPDPAYVAFVVDRVVDAVGAAIANAQPCRMAHRFAHPQGLGGNRLDPAGPSDLSVPCLFVRAADTDAMIGVVMVTAMHPTVLHEDTKQISGDFPSAARRQLAKHFPDAVCVSLMGASGNQSPRHVLRGYTFAEVERLGGILSDAVVQAAEELPLESYAEDWSLACGSEQVELPLRQFPSLADAHENLKQKQAVYQRLQVEGASAPEIRTAECACFGAEEVVTLSAAQDAGRLQEWASGFQQAEVQVMRIGPLWGVTWPAEVFVEYALQLKQALTDPVAVVTLANGESQGYVVTEEAEAAQTYEAQCSLVRPEAGDALVKAALGLIRRLQG